MRSAEGSEAKADCEDPMIKAACLIDDDSCPAECKDSESKDDDNTVVKSGDLAVTAKAAANTKILATWTADLDTITFKTSEDVEINKITLERYGYSKEEQITGIWLEDQDGNVIADSKTLSKDKVTLNLKKNYRTVDGKLEVTVVVKTEEASGTIGFKVTNVESSAKNTNLDDYSPYTYDVVDYAWSEVTVELKGSDKKYNYEEGESYEIARIKVAAGDAAVLVKGFTLTNAGKVDMKESLDELTIKADSKEVKAKYSVNKDDELVISFNDEVEIDMNKKTTFVLSASFKDFDDYWESIQYYIDEDADFTAVEKKNGTRVNLDIDAASKEKDDDDNYKYITTYTFNGGKIKLSNTKLGNVDAAQGSESIVVAEGNVTVTEPISKVEFDIVAKWEWAQYIKNLYFVIDGDEYDAGNPEETNEGLSFPFKGISIEKSGKIQFKVDIEDPREGIEGNPVINFAGSFNGEKLEGAKYDNVSKQYVQATDVAGSISFSKVTIQAAKAALENNLSTDVEFILNETSRKVVFDGTYTAKKGWDIDLNKFFIWSDEDISEAKNKITFYLFIDGEEVADTDTINVGNDDVKTAKTESFSDVRVEAGKSVKVKVEAEVEAYAETAGDLPADGAANFKLFLLWTDMSGNEDTGKWEEDLIGMKTKSKGSVTIPSKAQDKTAVLKKTNAEIATFTIKPSKNNDGITLEQLVLNWYIEEDDIEIADIKVNAWTEKDVVWRVADEYDVDEAANIAAGDLIYDLNEEIPSEGLTVTVLLKKKQTGHVGINLKSVNGKKFTNVYSKYLVDSLVTITKQDGQTLTLAVEHEDDAYSIAGMEFYALDTEDNECKFIKEVWEVKDGDTVTIARIDADQEICWVIYYVDWVENEEDFVPVEISKLAYPDYFKVSGKEIIIPAK